MAFFEAKLNVKCVVVLIELNSWCGSGSQLEKAQKPALFSFNFDYVTGNRSENGVLVALNCQDLVTLQISRLGGKLFSREPVDVT